MTAINKIPRGLRVLIVMVILAILVWKFAVNTNFYYYSIGIAVLITIGVIFAIYHSSGVSGEESKGKEKKKTEKSENVEELEADASEGNPETGDIATETLSVEEKNNDAPAVSRRRPEAPFKNIALKPKATDVAAMYRQMAEAASKEVEPGSRKPVSKQAVPQDVEPVAEEATDDQAKATEPGEDTGTNEPPAGLVEDESTLTEEDKNELVNAVWCRCENPYCKYTNFLSAHHIIDEKNGGTNRLDNLIVLCPYCHDLAHKNEIPEKEMRNWINNREERFKFKLEWRYH